MTHSPQSSSKHFLPTWCSKLQKSPHLCLCRVSVTAALYKYGCLFCQPHQHCSIRLQWLATGAYHIFLITTQYLSINRSAGSDEDRVWMAKSIFSCSTKHLKCGFSDWNSFYKFLHLALYSRHTYLFIVRDNVWHLIHTGDACCPDIPCIQRCPVNPCIKHNFVAPIYATCL